MLAKLLALDPPATALLDSEEIPITGMTDQAERVLTDQGYYVSSPVDGWPLHGPFGGPPQS
jgi:hypothetical protein